MSGLYQVGRDLVMAYEIPPKWKGRRSATETEEGEKGAGE